MAAIAVAVVSVGVGLYVATRSMSIPGQKLGDIAAQTAKEGEPRLIVWGIVRPVGGNLVAVQEPPRIERRKNKSGGKGGGPTMKTEHPHRTYAVGICEGPITGIRRVWRNNKLIYDGRPDSAWGKKNNHVFLRKARFFLGGYNQMPSADLEKVFGVGEVPAMRGTAYMVMVDEDLSDTGGAVPQWIFEVVRSEGFMVTSQPYVVEADTESVDISAKVPALDERAILIDASGGSEAASFGAQVTAIQFRSTLFTLEGQEPEVASFGAQVNEIRMWNVLTPYDHAEPELASFGAQVNGLHLHDVLVTYVAPVDDEVQFGAQVNEIFLNTQ